MHSWFSFTLQVFLSEQPSYNYASKRSWEKTKRQKRGSTSQAGPSVDAGAASIAEPPRSPEPPAEELEITCESDEEMIDVNSAPNKV